MMGNLAEELLQAAVAEQGGFGPGMGQAPKRVVNKSKKKSKRKQQRKARRKSQR